MTKLELLYAAAEFDVCAPGKDQRKRDRRYCRDSLPGVYPARLPDGGICNLFKVLMTNYCEYNCLYCANRKNRDVPRTEFTPEELAKTFINYYRKKLVQGLFLSSAIKDNAFKTMDQMLKCSLILRNKYGYKGYIHLKILPGASLDQMEQAIKIATRVSINLEAPSDVYLKRLAPQKSFDTDLMQKIEQLSSLLKKQEKPPSLTTQFVVGAVGEPDKDIIFRDEELRKKFGLRRTYFSAFAPISNTPLENNSPVPMSREHRLYQVDWLLTYYGFRAEEIPLDLAGNLSLDHDPKLLWAENNQHLFPIEINKASYEELLRVPGIGPISAKRILDQRQKSAIMSIKELRYSGVVTKRAMNYILLNGKSLAKEVSEPKQLELIPLNF